MRPAHLKIPSQLVPTAGMAMATKNRSSNGVLCTRGATMLARTPAPPTVTMKLTKDDQHHHAQRRPEDITERPYSDTDEDCVKAWDFFHHEGS